MEANLILLHNIREILNSYLDESIVRNFYKSLEGKSSSNGNDILDDYLQIEAEINSGTDKRAQIDLIITFAEENLEGEKLSKLLLSLCKLMIDNGELDIAEEINKDIIASPSPNALIDSVKADAYLGLAKIYWQQSIWDEALRFTKKAYIIFNNLNKSYGCARCENMLGTIFGERGEIDKATLHFENAKAYLYNHQNFEMKAMLETNLGVLYNMKGDYSKAIKNYTNSLKIYRKLGNQRLIARVTHNIGMVKTKMENYESALDSFNSSISISLKHNYLSNCAISYIAKAYIYYQINKADLAEAFTDKAMEIAYKLNDTLTIADIYRVKALIQKNQGNLEFSEELFENSIRLNKDKKNKINQAETEIELAEIYKKLNRTEDAKTHIKKAIKYYRKIKAEKIVIRLQKYLQSIT